MRDPNNIIETGVKSALDRAATELAIAQAHQNTVLSEHYGIIVYLCRMILEAVEDISTENPSVINQ